MQCKYAQQNEKSYILLQHCCLFSLCALGFNQRRIVPRRRMKLCTLILFLQYLKEHFLFIFCFDEKTAPFDAFVSFDESCMRETTKSFEKSFGWRNCNCLLLCWDAHAKDDYDGHKNFLFDDFSFESRGGELKSQKYFFNRQNFITYFFLSKRIPSK